ncbi:MAG: hypothetical protein KAW93_03095 [Methanogenium sp.]|nr:hypothetical protein [Methanogenium sp.]
MVLYRGGTCPGATEIRRARDSGWFSVIEPANTALVYLLKQELHAGEQLTSIVPASETKPDILLLPDEIEARHIAGLYNLFVTVIIGLSMQAKNEGQVASLRREMDRL